MPKARSGERRQEILQTLVQMLEQNRGEHITTAALAKAVGVSEAALYRHFPSKGKMLESLIEFIEESLFSRVNIILAEEKHVERRLQQIMLLLLGFADKNPGITRLMQGDVLVGENKKLRLRIAQLFDRLETQIRQVLREGELDGDNHLPVTETARLLLAVVEGRIAQFVRSEFRVAPTDGWPDQWAMLRAGLFGNSEVLPASGNMGR